MCAYIPTGGMRGFIWNAQDTTDKTPSGLNALIDQANNKGFNGVFFDEGGIYTPVSGQTYQDAYLNRTQTSPGQNGSGSILSVVGNSKYNAITAEAWKNLTVETYISRAKSYGMFVIVGCPDENVRSSRINSNIFPLVDAVLTSEEYNTRAPGKAPVGQEIPFTGKCFVLSYNGSYDAPSTTAAINYGFGAAYCCQSMGSLPSPAFENYMAAIPDEDTGLLKLALVFYGWHDTATDNRILAAKPAILIDNTPGGLWHGNCSPSKFQSQGIHVFSYIDSSYGARPLAENHGYIDAIAAEGSYGVFMDQVSPQNNAYNLDIYNYAKSKGLKVMLNPGIVPNANLYTCADFVMTDEQYKGRAPTGSEVANLAKTIVIGFGATTAAQAASWTQAAWANGFPYTWAEEVEYISLPNWLESYIALISPSAAAPLALGYYGTVAASGMVWNTTDASKLAAMPYGWAWLQSTYPYSGPGWTASALIAATLKNAGKKVLFRCYWADGAGISGVYNNWDQFVAGGSTAYNLAANICKAQINNVGLSNIYAITLQEEEPAIWGGSIANAITGLNAVAALLRAAYPGIKIIGSPSGSNWTNAQVQSLDTDGLLWYTYQDASDAATPVFLDRGVAIAVAKGWTLDKLYTLVCAQTTPTESWAPDSHVANITEMFNLCFAKGYGNIGFYTADEAGGSGNMMLNAYASDTGPEWLSKYRHQQAVATIIGVNIPTASTTIAYQVTIDHTRLLQTAPTSGVNIVQPVISDLVDYPIKIRLGAQSGFTNFDTQAIFAALGSNWKGLHLTAQGVSCKMEMVLWDSVNKLAIIYAKIPLVSKTVDTQLLLFTGADNPDIGLTRSAVAESVWDAGHFGVWHGVELGTGAPAEYKDSTSHHHDGRGGGPLLANGTNTGSAPTRLADALMGFVQHLNGNGSNNWIAVPALNQDFDINLASGFTVTCFLALDNIAFQGSNYFCQAVQHGNSVDGYQWEDTFYSTLEASRPQWVVPYVYGKTGGLGNGADARQNYAGYPKPQWANNQWFSIGLLIDKPSGSLKGGNIYALYNGIAYRGSSDAEGVTGNTPSDYPPYVDLNNYGGFGPTTAPLVFGSSYNRKSASVGGNLAEIHISAIQRSDSWIAAEHYSGLDLLAKYEEVTVVTIERGIFRWEMSLSALQNTAEMMTFLEKLGFSQVFLYFYISHLGGSNATLVQNLINACHAKNIEVFGIINHGGISAAHPPNPDEGHVNEGGVLKSDHDLITAYLTYNATHTKFDGLVFDIEDLKGIADLGAAYMATVKTYAYNGQTIVSQGMKIAMYLDSPYYLAGQPYGNAAGVAKAKTLYALLNLVLINSYRPTAPENVAAAQDGPKTCYELGIYYALGLDCTPGFGNAFDGTAETYLLQVSYIDTSTASNIAPYRQNYVGTYLNAYNYVNIAAWEEQVNNIFAPGAAKTAKVPVTVVPSGIPCECEVYLGPNQTTKTVTSGKIAFTSTGASQTVNCPVTMPTAAGAYHVYIALTSGGFLIAGFVDVNDVVILSGDVGPIVW